MTLPLFRLFIASTLDGFIAREDGSLDWLFALPNPTGTDHGYNDFISNIDMVVMGRKTYDEVLGFGVEWPYPNCITYVFTTDKNYQTKTPNTFTLHEITPGVTDKLRSESSKNIWIVGGGNVIAQFLNLKAVDEMTISIIPLLLGGGIRLFTDFIKETNLELIESTSFDTGVLNITYTMKG